MNRKETKSRTIKEEDILSPRLAGQGNTPSHMCTHKQVYSLTLRMLLSLARKCLQENKLRVPKIQQLNSDYIYSLLLEIKTVMTSLTQMLENWTRTKKIIVNLSKSLKLLRG